MRVLIVEDDRRLAASLRRSLMESRMAVDVAHEGDDGLTGCVDDALRCDRPGSDARVHQHEHLHRERIA